MCVTTPIHLPGDLRVQNSLSTLFGDIDLLLGSLHHEAIDYGHRCRLPLEVVLYFFPVYTRLLKLRRGGSWLCVPLPQSKVESHSLIFTAACG